MDSIHGKMGELSKANTLMIKSMDMESMLGRMVGSIKEIGSTGSNMD